MTVNSPTLHLGCLFFAMKPASRIQVNALACLFGVTAIDTGKRLQKLQECIFPCFSKSQEDK